MNFKDGFLSIKEGNETKTKIKGSVFICFSFPVNSVDEAHFTLEKIRKKYFDATHYCYALHLSDETIKYSDDGEPNGTAGIRILNAIQHFGLKNILVVVVRYFGGTKLGTGLLGKTYYEAAEINLTNIKTVTYLKYDKYEITIDFDEQSFVYKVLNSFNCIIQDTSYTEKVSFIVLVKPEVVPDFKQNLVDITKGKVLINFIETVFHLS